MDGIASAQMLSQMLGSIDGAVLTARAAKADGKMAESPSEVSLDGRIYQAIDMVEKTSHALRGIEKVDDRLVLSRQRLIFLIASGIVYGTTVEHEATTIAAGVLGNAAAVGETGNLNRQPV